MTRYGYNEGIWNQAKEEMKSILIKRAQNRAMITYSDLVRELKTIKFSPDSYPLFHMLGEISVEEDGASRGMLSVLVVHKEGDMQPGRGFFELAKGLERDTTDVVKCWVDELKKVYAYWSNI